MCACAGGRAAGWGKVRGERELFGQLISICLARTAGDWGDDTRYAAADLASDLAGMEPWLPGT